MTAPVRGGLAALVLGLALGACTPSSPSVPQGAGFPATLEHKYGTTVVEAAPQRVITLGLVDQDAFVALGVVPVATQEWYGKKPGALFPWAQKRLGDAPLPEVLEGELDFERIAALNPDVIVALYAGLTQEEYDTLSKIAPTVAQPRDVPDWRADWKTITRTAGVIVGKSTEAEALISDLEGRFAAIRQAYPGLQGKAAAVNTWGWPQSVYVFGTQDPRTLFLKNLGYTPLLADPGLTVPLAAGDSVEKGTSLSHENLRVLDQGTVLWFTDAPDHEAALRGDPLYSQLELSSSGRSFFLSEGNPWYDALSFSSVLSLPFLLDDFVPTLAGGEAR